jgi:predicted dehydrogenase
VDRPLHLALLGCGEAAKMNGRALHRLGGEAVCSYASRDRERARRFASELGGLGSFASYAAALESPEVDVAVILTPPSSHLDLTLAALAAGKHVVVEKPPFLHAADFDAVAEACSRAGRQVLVAENYYYKPLAVHLRRQLARGVIGDVLFLCVNTLKEQPVAGWRADAGLAGGGALFEGGIHWVNFMANLGLVPRSAHGMEPAPRGVQRSMLALFDYEGGAVGALFHSWEVPSPLKGLRVSRIYGREGTLTFESNGLFLLVWGKRKTLIFPGLRDIAGRGAMWRDFVTALRAGTRTEMDLSRARRDLELVESILAARNVQGKENGC